MSYGIVRIQKFSANAVGGIQIHDKRLKQGTSHSNPDIDWERTKLNYNLAPEQNYHKAIKQRINSLNLKKAVRKDAVVMAQCLVTSDHDFFETLKPADTIRFFQDSYDFLKNRYSEENIISAVVHLDERTPHMHFNFVPVTPDGRLSAKSLFTPKSLREQQTDFQEEVGSRYGLQRGESGTKKKHLETAEFKKATAFHEIEAAKAEIADLSKGIVVIKGKVLAAEEIHRIQPKKGLGGGIKNITLEDIENLKQMALRYQHLKIDYDELKNEHIDLQEKTKDSIAMYMELEQKNKVILKLESSLAKEKSEKEIAEWKIKRMEDAIKSDRQLYNRYQEARREVSPYFQQSKQKNKGPSLTR